MNEEAEPKRNLLYRFDRLIKIFIPNFNVRAIVYLSVLFAVALYIQVWRISSPSPVIKPAEEKQETVIADQAYWDSPEYKQKLKNQTVDSFAKDLERWLNRKDQEFSKRKFEDMLFINGGLTTMTGGDLTVVVPESFNYLENHARARYQYARDKGFLNDAPLLVRLGKLVCDIDSKTEQVTDVELYDWRYASMPKLAAFMKTKPDWKVQVGNRIFDVSDPRIEDKEILKLRSPQTQPVGLFSFLLLRNAKDNRIVVADSTMLERNGIDATLTLTRIGSHWDKQPKLYFQHGYEGCRQLGSAPNIDYGQFD